MTPWDLPFAASTLPGGTARAGERRAARKNRHIRFFSRRPRSAQATAVELFRQGRRPVVVTALPLRQPARDQLAALMGDVDVYDIRDAVGGADIVIAPPCSPQAIGALKGLFPRARLVLVELDDWESGLESTGPVKRALAAGADAYVLADGVAELAQVLRSAQPRDDAHQVSPSELTAGAVDDLIVANVHDVILRQADR